MKEKDIKALIANGATIETRITVLPSEDGEEILTLSNMDFVKDWAYKDFRYVDKQGVIGQFVARQLEGNLQDVDDDFNIENREIGLYLGVRVYDEDFLATQSDELVLTQDSVMIHIENEHIPVTEDEGFITHWYHLGNFFVTKPESNEVNDNTKFEALDYTILFNRAFDWDYTDDEFTTSFADIVDGSGSVTAYWLAKYVCNQCHVRLGSTEWTFSDFEIDSNQFDSDDTCRDVIKAIAKLGYTWARIGWDDKLYFDFKVQKEVTSEYNVLSNNDYYNLKTQKEPYGEVNRVLVGSSITIGNNEIVEDTESIEENGLTELDIYDNPLVWNEELRKEVIKKGDCLLGFKYTPLSMETTGHPWLLGNELIEVDNMEDKPLYTYAFDRTLRYTGHIKSDISSSAQTDIESTYAEYDGIDSTATQIKRSRVQLDRANQELLVLQEKTDEQGSTISTIKQNLDGTQVELETLINKYEGTITTTKEAVGNPIYINDGSSDLTSYYIPGKTTQYTTPTPSEPQALKSVEGISNLVGFATPSFTQSQTTVEFDNGTSEEQLEETNGTLTITTTGGANGLAKYDITSILKNNIGEILTFDYSNLDLSNAKGSNDIIASIEYKINNGSSKYHTLSYKDEHYAGVPFVVPEHITYGALVIYTNNSSTATDSKIIINDPVLHFGEHIETYIPYGNYKYLITKIYGLNLYAGYEVNPIVRGLSHGTNVYSSDDNAYGVIIPIIGGKTYSISKAFDDTPDPSDEDDKSNEHLRLGVSTSPTYPTIGGEARNITIKNSDKKVTIKTSEGSTTTEPDKFLFVEILNTDTISKGLLETAVAELQIEISEEPTEYSTPSYQEVPYKLDNIVLDSITNDIGENGDDDEEEGEAVNTEDNINIVTGVLTKKIASIVLDGEESWTKDSDDNIYYITLSDMYNPSENELTTQVISNYFEGTYENNVSNLDYCIALVHGENYGKLAIKHKDITTLNAFKTWIKNRFLDQEPVVVKYVMIEPVISDIGTETYTLQNETTIYTEADQNPPTTAVQYSSDSQLNGQYATVEQWLLNKDSIDSLVQQTQTLFDGVNNSITTINDQVEALQTASQVQYNFTHTVETDGVTKVDTKTGITLDEQGITVNKDGSATKTVIDETGMNVYDTTGSAEEPLLQVDTTGVVTNNLKVNTYMTLGTKSRFEDYEDGTGCFYIGG